MKYSLIIPIIRVTAEQIPNEYKIGDHGMFNFYANMVGINYKQISDIYIVYLKEHEKYVKNPINNYNIFNCKTHFWCLDKATNSEPETIYKTIKLFNITGPIFIKDSDHYFSYDDEVYNNGVITYSLEDVSNKILPKTLSYVAIDNNMQITNIIEKRIISNVFNCGGYIFEDANDFIDAYDSIIYIDMYEKMYVSHIIYYLMLFKNIKFTSFNATFYK